MKSIYAALGLCMGSLLSVSSLAATEEDKPQGGAVRLTSVGRPEQTAPSGSDRTVSVRLVNRDGVAIVYAEVPFHIAEQFLDKDGNPLRVWKEGSLSESRPSESKEA